MMNDSFCRIIAGEIQARPEQVDAAVRLLDVRLLDEGNTVPFIARYRKEITGGLDDTRSCVITETVWMTRSCVIWKRV